MARNAHPGPCYACGLIVSAGEGRCERYKGYWRTKHANVSGDGRITCSQAQAVLSGTGKIVKINGKRCFVSKECASRFLEKT